MPEFAGLRRSLFEPREKPANPAGLIIALVGFAGLFVGHQVVLLTGALVVKLLLIGGDLQETQGLIEGSLVMLLPAAVPLAYAAWWLAGRRGGDPREVLNLRAAGLGAGAWALLIVSFFAAMVAVTWVVLTLAGAPGIDGAVKQAMGDIARNPALFALVLPSIVLGAPLAEEIIFRGQIFTALAATRLGYSGATVITAALWSLAHFSEGRTAMVIIFAMGLMFGWMLYRFGSLRVTFACHAAWNLVNGIVMLAGASQT